MNWYYADAGQQAGPIDDLQLQELVNAGRITPDTLVWREGMENWQPYREVAPAAAAPAAAAAPPVYQAETPEAVCAECNRIFNKQDMIRYGTVHVCAACKPVFMQKLSEGAAIRTGDLRYAGFWIRFAAKFIDGLILGVFLIVPTVILMFNMGLEPSDSNAVQFQLLQIFIQLGYMAINCAYTIFFLGKYGATPGKMACKLQVVMADGSKISYGRATGRFFADILSGMICYIGYIIVAFDDQKRALHDHICNTRVIYKS